jgi:hypothetical protein
LVGQILYCICSGADDRITFCNLPKNCYCIHGNCLFFDYLGLSADDDK